MERRIKVRLTNDLTMYDPSLIPGVEGYTVGQYEMWSKGSDRFIGVHFPDIGTFDILWDGLEIIDAEYLALAAEREKKKWNVLKGARDVTRTVGPAGGFKYISYEYTDENGTIIHTSSTGRNEAEKLLKFFKEHGIEIKEKVLKRR